MARDDCRSSDPTPKTHLLLPALLVLLLALVLVQLPALLALLLVLVLVRLPVLLLRTFGRFLCLGGEVEARTHPAIVGAAYSGRV